MKHIFKYLNSLFQLFLPSRCAVCHLPLKEGEKLLCMKCMMGIPKTEFHLKPANPMEQRFWGIIPIERAAAYFYYSKESRYAQLIRQLKYHSRPDIGRILGKMAAKEMGKSFFQDIDYLIPVPLHPKREKKRGYNQSEEIAIGIAEIYDIPIDTSIRRVINTATQTKKSATERWKNVQGIFESTAPLKFTDKHLLIIDDVMTTGATLISCAESVLKAERVRISVLTLGCVME